MYLRTRLAFVGLLLLFGFTSLGWAADFSIVLAGTPRYCFLRDVNRGADGYLGFEAALATLSGGVVNEDNRSPMNFVMGYSIDFRLALNSEYSVVLGVGNLRIRSTSDVLITYTDGQPDARAFAETKIDAFPIKLSVIRSYPLTRSLSAFTEAGVAVWIARYRSSLLPAGPGDTHVQDAHAVGIGPLIAGGLEIKASRYLALILKAEGDYAQIRGFKGTRDSGGSTIPHEERGTLYYEETAPLGAERVFPLLMIYDDKPATALRQARIDLSGFSLSAGLRISF
jgi:hypothetical protein